MREQCSVRDAVGAVHKLKKIICVDINMPTAEQVSDWNLLPESTGDVEVEFSTVNVSDKQMVQELFEYARDSNDALSVFHLSSIVSGQYLSL